MNSLRKIIESAWDDRTLLKEEITINTIREVVDLLDKGKLRVAEPEGDVWVDESEDVEQ